MEFIKVNIDYRDQLQINHYYIDNFKSFPKHNFLYYKHICQISNTINNFTVKSIIITIIYFFYIFLYFYYTFSIFLFLLYYLIIL